MKRRKRAKGKRAKDDTTNDYIRSRRADVDAALDRMVRAVRFPSGVRADLERMAEQVRARPSTAHTRKGTRTDSRRSRTRTRWPRRREEGR